ncbi:hypothetical protein HDV63DRAFT_395732 [Trichoderma sp. SZMC 28014]
MPVTVAIVNHAAKNWKAPKVTTDSELLKETYPKQHDTMQPSPNGFVYSAYIAYIQHHHLTIRPDDVWFAILSQFGFYVKSHSKELRGLIIPRKITDVEEFSPSNSESRGHWTLISGLNELIVQTIKDPELLEWAMPSFSTTTDTDRAVATVLLLGTMQKYYRCTLVKHCGLPSVTLLGEVEDWRVIRGKLDYLRQFGDLPSQFADMLHPILRLMINSFTHSTSEEIINFWKTMATDFSLGMVGETTKITGWIATFCFWDEEGRAQLRRPWNTLLDGENYPIIPVNRIPAGSACVPMKAIMSGNRVECTAIAGSVGIQAFSLPQPGVPAETTSSRSTEDELPPSKLDADGLQVIQPISGWWVLGGKKS